MTAEEKAKAYDEALERARKHYEETPNNVYKSMLESLFPELTESEDEKIRKELIEHIKANSSSDFVLFQKFSPNDVLVWLEKQAEHQKFRDSIQVGDKVTRNEDGVLVNLSQLNRIAKKDEKQGKQKPVEWKQENREELTEFENAMMHIGGSFFGENAGLDPNDTDTIKEQAELLLELAPKTEWSEEDRTMAFTLMRDVDQISYISKEGKNERIGWLNSLDEKFASTESAWSEEDEENFKGVMDALNFCNHEGINPYDIDPLYLVSWLKSIKQRMGG